MKRRNPLALSLLLAAALTLYPCAAVHTEAEGVAETENFADTDNDSDEDDFWNRYGDPDEDDFWNRYGNPDEDDFWSRYGDPDEEDFWDRYGDPDEDDLENTESQAEEENPADKGNVNEWKIGAEGNDFADTEPIAGAEWFGNAPTAMLSMLPKLARAKTAPQAGSVAMKVKCSDEDLACKKMLDGLERTSVMAKRKTVFTFTPKEPVESVYLKFERECSWTLTLPDGTELTPGEENFIHKYIPLGQSVDSFRLTLPTWGRLTDVYAFTHGEPPDWVQRWELPCDRADLLVMSAHADDEHLWFGGAMPYYAGELGYDVQVVYLTDHRYATIRNHERLNGLWTVGVTHYPVIGEQFIDVVKTRRSLNAAAETFGYDKVTAFEVEMLRRFSPRVVISHDINGEYGHGAHKLLAKTLLEALPLTGDPSQYPESAKKYGTCQVGKCYLHLWKERTVTVNWSDKRLLHFNGRTALDMARKGFACHRSQRQIFYSVKESGPYDCRLFGLAYTRVGDDTEGVNDLFEHIEIEKMNTEN